MTCVVDVVCNMYYCMWHLVFSSIINNRIRLHILYRNLIYAHLSCACVYTIDTWLDIWFYYSLFSYFIYELYCHCTHNTPIIIILCKSLFSHFAHSLGVFWLPWICIFRFKDILFCWIGVWERSYILWEAGVSLYVITRYGYYCSL